MAPSVATAQATSRLKAAIAEYLRVYGSDKSQSSVVTSLRTINGRLGGGDSNSGPPSPGSKAAAQSASNNASQGPPANSGGGKPPFPIKQTGTAKALALQRFKKKGARG